MDPEIYVFPRINSALLKLAASTTIFIVVLLIVQLLTSLIPGPHFWKLINPGIKVGSTSIRLASLLHLLIGYTLFVYGSYHAWRATRQKNTVENSNHQLATRVLDSGYYGRVRHPMYGMFIMANVGLGFAMNSIYGLTFAMLSLILFVANGIFEERSVMLRFFGEEYRAYMHRVTARYFTPAQAIVIAFVLALYAAGLLF
jgi:protein-S-isoprenylcysteine O-methyltransferase Ste14